MFVLIILSALLLLFYTPSFEIKVRLGNKEIKFEIGNVTNLEGKKPIEDIIINSSTLDGAFTLNTGGNLYNVNGSFYGS